MKIAFLNDLIYDYAFQAQSQAWMTGGAERQQLMLARAMASSGWEVAVGVRRSSLPPGQSTVADGVRFVGIGRGHILRAWNDFFRAERPEWWFWQCASHLFGFGVAMAHAAGARTIFGVGVDGDVHVRTALYRRRWLWPAYALGLSRTDCIALQHEGQRHGLPARWSWKASVVPNIVPPPGAVVPHARREPSVAWIAALRVQKRPDRLIELARLVPHVRFVVCGSATTFMTPPGYSERAIELFRTLPNIDYRGQVSPDEALRISRESSLLLSTSQEEGYPQTFLEAWSYGTPVVTLGINPGSVITDHGLGAVCPDVQSAATVIDSLLRHGDERERMAGRTRQYVAEAHSSKVAVAALERALLGRDRGAGEPTAVGGRSPVVHER